MSRVKVLDGDVYSVLVSDSCSELLKQLFDERTDLMQPIFAEPPSSIPEIDESKPLQRPTAQL